jgi:hypothetical protein
LHERDQRLVLLGPGGVDAVGLVLADARGVRRDHRHLELEVLPQLVADVDRGRRHAAQRGVEPDVGLDRDGAEHLALGAGVEPLLRLDRGVQAVRPAPALGDPAPHLVDELDRPVADDVVDVALQQRVGVQGHVDGRQLGDVPRRRRG